MQTAMSILAGAGQSYMAHLTTSLWRRPQSLLQHSATDAMTRCQLLQINNGKIHPSTEAISSQAQLVYIEIMLPSELVAADRLFQRHSMVCAWHSFTHLSVHTTYRNASKHVPEVYVVNILYMMCILLARILSSYIICINHICQTMQDDTTEKARASCITLRSHQTVTSNINGGNVKTCLPSMPQASHKT